MVKDRNSPIERIVKLTPETDDEAELIELIAEGSARLPMTNDPLPSSFWRDRLPKANIDLIGLVRTDRDA